MNASEFAYWYRRGYGPIFGADLDSSKKSSPFAVAAFGAGQLAKRVGHGVGHAAKGVSQAVRTVTPHVSWSPEQKADIRQATKKVAAPFVKAGQGLFRTGPQRSDAELASQISFADPKTISPYVSDEEASAIRFGPAGGATAEQIRGEMFGLFVESDLDEIDMDLEDLERESFGIAPAIAIGVASAVPALLLAIKGKKKRLASLKKKLQKLEAKAEGASGKKADRIAKKMEKIQARIEKLEAKLGEDSGAEDREDENEDEAMGLGPGLGSTYTYVPAALEPDDSPYAFGFEPVSPQSGRAVQILSAEWLGRAGVTQIRDDLWREGPVIVVSVVGGVRPPTFPRRVAGMKVVFVPSSSSYGSIPTELLGSHQLWPADAATADEGTIIAVPVVPDHRLDPWTEDAVRDGVGEFLGEFERRARWSSPRR